MYNFKLLMPWTLFRRYLFFFSITAVCMKNIELLSVEAEENFLKITSSGRLEDSYLELRQIDSSSTYPEEDPERREEICEAILNSSSFFNIHQNLMSLKMMQENYFASENDNLRNIPSRITKLYQQRQIFTRDGTLYESLLLCSAWDSVSRTIEEYFVSRQYRARKTISRFIFAFNEKKKLVVIAKTETTS